MVGGMSVLLLQWRNCDGNGWEEDRKRLAGKNAKKKLFGKGLGTSLRLGLILGLIGVSIPKLIRRQPIDMIGQFKFRE